MLKKIAFAGLGLALLVFPSFALAQVDVQSQIAGLLAQIKQLQVLIQQMQGQGGTSTASCLALQNNLYLDQTDATTNGEVTKLQQFLGGRVTGYYGPATLQLVQQWQSSHNVVSSGDPDTTGYGYAGPKTRTAMGCGTAPQLQPTPAPTITGSTNSCPPSSTFVRDECMSNNEPSSVVAQPMNGSAPLRVAFTVGEPSASGCVHLGAKWELDYGDGTSDSVTYPGPYSVNGNPTSACNALMMNPLWHVYATTGTYRPQLCTGSGCSGRSDLVIQVGADTAAQNPPPVQAGNCGQNAGCNASLQALITLRSREDSYLQARNAITALEKSAVADGQANVEGACRNQIMAATSQSVVPSILSILDGFIASMNSSGEDAAQSILPQLETLSAQHSLHSPADLALAQKDLSAIQNACAATQ